MSKFDKVVNIFRSTIIAITMIVTNTVGTAYIADDVVYEEWFGSLLVIAWGLFSSYKITRWLIRDVNEVLKK